MEANTLGFRSATALRVGFSALFLLALWRPWRWPLTRTDAKSVVRYGVALIAAGFAAADWLSQAACSRHCGHKPCGALAGSSA